MAEIVAKGIDISSHQGADIDFDRVKKAGYSFVIIKAGQGFTEMETFRTHPDYRYLQRVQAAGLDWGAYWWSDAVSVEQAKREAECFLASLDGLKPTYPVYMDQEYASPCGKWGPGKNKQLRTDMANAFLEVLQDAGYYAGLYSSFNWLKEYVYDAQLTKWDKWVAQYYKVCQYDGAYGMWQHHGNAAGYVGRVDGISVPVDLNDCYMDYPGIIKAHGLNGWTPQNPSKPAAPAEPDYKAFYMDVQALVEKYKGA